MAQAPLRNHCPRLYQGASQGLPPPKPAAFLKLCSHLCCLRLSSQPFPKPMCFGPDVSLLFCVQALCSQGSPPGLGTSEVQGALYTLQKAPRKYPLWGKQPRANGERKPTPLCTCTNWVLSCKDRVLLRPSQTPEGLGFGGFF